MTAAGPGSSERHATKQRRPDTANTAEVVRLNQLLLEFRATSSAALQLLKAQQQQLFAQQQLLACDKPSQKQQATPIPASDTPAVPGTPQL